MKIKFELNGHPIEIDENPKKKLSEFLRQNNYFSIKNGCGKGNCTVCTILQNDNPILSCLTPLAEIEETKITTLEHFMKSDDYSDIEKSFKQQGINFCGYCNTGKIFMTYKIIKENPMIKKSEIRNKISFFTCNCVELDSFTNAIYVASVVRKNRLQGKNNGK